MTFLRRLVSTVILWSVILAALFSGNKLISDYVLLAIMVFLAGFGLAEFYGLVEKRGLVCFKGWGLIGGPLLMVGTFLHCTGKLGLYESPSRVNDFEASFLILFVLGLCVRQFASRSNTAGILAISTTLFGLMYVPWLLNFIQKINFFPGIENGGRFYVLYFILVTKFSDTGAYAVGSTQDDPPDQPRENLGRVCGRDSGFHAGQRVVRASRRRKIDRHELETRDHPWHPAEHDSGDWRFD